MNIIPIITISVVSHGDANKIHTLLTSLKNYEQDTKRFQIILTDNLNNELPEIGSTPWESLHILRNKRPVGFAHNHNRAFESAKGKYFAILNPDLVFEQPVFGKLIARLDSGQADLIAPRIVDENGTIQDSFRFLPTPHEIIRRRLPGYKFEALKADGNGLIHPDWIAGMFWLMKSDMYRQMGGMDVRYRLYFEDVDFCTRVQLKRKTLLVDTQVQVRHDAQRSSRRRLYYLFLHSRSALRFFMSSVYRQARQKTVKNKSR